MNDLSFMLFEEVWHSVKLYWVAETTNSCFIIRRKSTVSFFFVQVLADSILLFSNISFFFVTVLTSIFWQCYIFCDFLILLFSFESDRSCIAPWSICRVIAQFLANKNVLHIIFKIVYISITDIANFMFLCYVNALEMFLDVTNINFS